MTPNKTASDLAIGRKFNEFIFVIIESKHIYYSISMTHKITSVLLRMIRLKTLIPDLLNWLYYSEKILPFSQVNHLSQCRVKKFSCSEYPPPPPHLHQKAELSLRRHSTLY